MDYERLIKWLREFEGPGSSGTNEAADAIEDIWADFSKALEKLAESRARFADSEARRAELEAVIEKVRSVVTSQSIVRNTTVCIDTGLVTRVLIAAPSVVLEDRDRENRAIGWDEALAHAWKLNDPAYTVITDTESIHPIVTEADIYQAKRENPYRGDNR